ncbi:MAG TPA: aldehyde dehydrogenase family protein [Candidatus Rubrimentiphilum sp.]|nr:aldehyde dehydrogenase family protein [Candidatus Rubrimentiphilum sp.]
MSVATAVHGNYIGGEWRDGAETYRSVNPSNTSDVVGEYTRGDRDDAKKAIEAARAASPAWSRSNLQQRFDLLDRIGSEILSRAQELGTLLSREEGKTLPEGVGEATRAGHIFKFFAGEVLRLSGELVPSMRPGIGVEITREPAGVAALITPWNFPLAIPAWKIAPALAYGNCVVFKPAELVPACAWALSEIIVRNLAEIYGASAAGAFNLVMGSGSRVGDALVTSAGVDALSFTGSVAVGKSLAVKAADRFLRIQLEMGGKNPLIVLDDADLDVAVNCAVQGAYYSTGQRCTASSRLIVTQEIHDRFVAAMIEKMKTLVVDDALKPGTHIGPVVDERQLAQDVSYLEIAESEGARRAHGGERVACGTEGYYLSPVLWTETTPEMRINREEIFGPAAAVIRVKDYDDAIAIANDTEFGLCAGICTTSLRNAARFKRDSETGMVMVNLPTAGVDYHVPFGGRKGSSYGPREQGSYAREFYSIVKTAYILP